MKKNVIKSSLLVTLPFFLLAILVSCGGGDSGFPTSKKFWTPEDYLAVNQELTSLKYNDKEMPNLDNPNNANIFRKIVDTTNVTVVTTDNQLGVKYRSDFASSMFDQYRDLVSAYSGLDRSDKYKYPEELVGIWKFGLVLQVYYITLSNENSMKNSDNPGSSDVLNLISRNKNVIIGNYDLYLDIINFEERFNDKALISYAEGLKYFARLINVVAPDGDYASMSAKIDNMLKKTKNTLIAAELQNIQNLIKSKIAPVPAA
ncbi:MAG: hypothetical protein ABI480_03295 [Chitinophagaceae bacterium]